MFIVVVVAGGVVGSALDRKSAKEDFTCVFGKIVGITILKIKNRYLHKRGVI